MAPAEIERIADQLSKIIERQTEMLAAQIRFEGRLDILFASIKVLCDRMDHVDKWRNGAREEIAGHGTDIKLLQRSEQGNVVNWGRVWGIVAAVLGAVLAAVLSGILKP